MAIVTMKKMRLVGLSSEKERLLDLINKLKCVELKSSDEIENTHTRLNTKRQSETQEKLNKINLVIEFLNEELNLRLLMAKTGKVEFVPPKKPMFAVRRDVSHEEFLTSTRYEIELFSKFENIYKVQGKKAKAQADIASYTNELNTLLAFDALDLPLNSIKDTANVNVYLGQVPENASKTFNTINDLEYAQNYIVEKNGSLLTAVVVCHKQNAEEVEGILNDSGFVKSSLDTDFLPSERILKIREEIEGLNQRLLDLNKEAVDFIYVLDEAKQLYDYYSFKLEKINAQGEFRRTEKELAYVLEGWVPSNKIDLVEKQIDKHFENIVVEVTDPEENDTPPTLTNNGKIVKAFESVTNMYSTPSYKENDPNLAMTIFFFIFFGFMLSDAGYGLILAIACSVLLKFFKLESGMKNLVIILALGGVSTIIWGIIFGGFFSITVEGTIFEKIMWFAPLDNPIGALAIALGLGVIQILFGMGMKAAELFKRGQWVDALCDIGSWYVLFAGIGVFALGMVPGFEAVGNIGMYIAIAGVALLILTQGRAQKNIFMKLFKGVSSLYGIVNYVSDILSYARLFGLGLASGVVGMVFNIIAGVFMDILGGIPVVGTVLGLIVAVVFILFGHTLNIGINVLGAYVHDCRLQFIEFFSKFYEGGGHIFVPLGTNTKFVKVEDCNFDKA